MRIRPAKRRCTAVWLIPIFILFAGAAVIYRLQAVFMTSVACYANTVITDRVNRAVYDAFSDDDVFEEAETDKNGRITALTAYMPKINRLKAKMVVCVQDELGKITEDRVYVPLFAAIGVPMLSGGGIMLPVSVIPMTTVDDSFEESFVQSGINQTLYKLSINIEASITYCCFNFSRSETITTAVPLISTVINSDVPSYYGILSGTDAEVGE